MSLIAVSSYDLFLVWFVGALDSIKHRLPPHPKHCSQTSTFPLVTWFFFGAWLFTQCPSYAVFAIATTVLYPWQPIPVQCTQAATRLHGDATGRFDLRLPPLSAGRQLAGVHQTAVARLRFHRRQRICRRWPPLWQSFQRFHSDYRKPSEELLVLRVFYLLCVCLFLWLSGVGQLLVSLQDVALMPSRASFSTAFPKGVL